MQKAEGDYASALRELRARKAPNYDAACFHAQQCAEKYLKACLQERDIPFGKTHDLSVLLSGLAASKPALELLRPALRALSVFAVEYRYPGESADKKTAKDVVGLCTEIRKELRAFLKIKE